MMSRVKKGMVAGFVATLAVSLLEAVNLMFGPWVDPFPGLVARMIGMPGNLAVGWIAHFVIGTAILGSLFGILCPRLPTDTPETKGILFAVAAWVLMMLAIVLVGDPRTFTGSAGFGVIGWMLATHAVFGIVLGNVYARLVRREKMHPHIVGGAPAH